MHSAAVAFRMFVDCLLYTSVLITTNQITLQPGDYKIDYHVSALLPLAGYIQVTPVYNGAGHLDVGVYFRTGNNNSSVEGSQSIIIHVPSTTSFSLRFNSDVVTNEGTVTITFLKLA